MARVVGTRKDWVDTRNVDLDTDLVVLWMTGQPTQVDIDLWQSRCLHA